MSLAIAENTGLIQSRTDGATTAVLRGPAQPSSHPEEVLVDLVPRTAYVDAAMTPLRARQANLDAVVEAFDRAGIDYCVVRGMDDRASVIGVSESVRTTVLSTLKALMARQPGYVVRLQPRSNPRDFLYPSDGPTTWSTMATAKVLRLVWFRTDPAHSLVYGPEYGCEIEFWATTSPGQLTAPRVNRMARRIDRRGTAVQAPGERFTRLAPAWGTSLPPVRTREAFVGLLPDDLDFPIDLVYTWVDGSDPQWRRRKAAVTAEVYHDEVASDARFISRDELRYSLRSVYLNAPWVRNIYIVTDQQRPSWLDTSAGNIFLVDHADIFSDPSVLPTYNSLAIESQLHRIDDLAEHFLYLNDDMFFGRPVLPQDFFLANGNSKFFLSPTRVDPGPIDDRDTPSDAAIKNNRRIIQERFGRTITQSTWHVPYPLQRSVLAELEQEYPEEHRVTMASRFRAKDNISTTYSLYHYYAFHTGRAVPGSVSYGYVQLAVPDLTERLARALARRDWDTFCLNDAFSSKEEIERQNEVLRPFFEQYFPIPSPYERRNLA